MLLRSLVLLATVVAAPVAFAQGLPAKYQAGTHYLVIEPAQPTSAPAGNVEVVEIFSYACIHCAHFQPMVDRWKAKKPANATFVYLPAAWSQPWEWTARAFYAADALGVLDKTHAKFFDALHVQHVPIKTFDDIAQWYAENAGVDAAQFTQVANSFAINAKIQKSKQSVPRYGVDGTPSLVVAGKYRITGQTAGGLEQMFDVADFLIAMESGATPAPAKQ